MKVCMEQKESDNGPIENEVNAYAWYLRINYGALIICMRCVASCILGKTAKHCALCIWYVVVVYGAFGVITPSMPLMHE